MDRVHLRAVGRGIDEQGEAAVPRPGPAIRAELLAANGQIRGIAVVAVGDQRLAGREIGRDRVVRGGVGDRPEPVPDAVRRAGARHRRPVVHAGRPVPRQDRRRRRRDRWARRSLRSRSSAPAGPRPGRPWCSRAAGSPSPTGRGLHRPQQPTGGVPARLAHLVHVQRGRVVDAEQPTRPRHARSGRGHACTHHLAAVASGSTIATALSGSRASSSVRCSAEMTSYGGQSSAPNRSASTRGRSARNGCRASWTGDPAVTTADRIDAAPAAREQASDTA